jgi:hypothetical protein
MMSAIDISEAAFPTPAQAVAPGVSAAGLRALERRQIVLERVDQHGSPTRTSSRVGLADRGWFTIS